MKKLMDVLAFIFKLAAVVIAVLFILVLFAP